ncbi:hypothetical protein WDU94_001950 [Cyamophila willieti]
MISKLATSWILLTISLTLTPDQTLANTGSTVPLENATPAKGSPVGKLLPKDKFEKLCAAPAEPELCKNCLQGTPDNKGACAALGKALGFKVAGCKEVMPDIKDQIKYNACGLADSKLKLGDPNWYYVTAKDLGKHLDQTQTCKNNGLSSLVVKV